MASAVAGEVLGPRPGKAICSFWQGNMEVALRVAGIVIGAVPALITAAVALATSDSVPMSSDASDNSTFEAVTEGVVGSTGFLVALSVLAIVMEILFIVVRICNIGLINLKIIIFLIIDVIFSVLFAVGYVAVGIATAFFADATNVGSPYTLFNSMAAAAFFCFLAGLIFVFLAVWSIVYMVKDWNKKVIKYTLKEAITG